MHPSIQTFGGRTWATYSIAVDVGTPSQSVKLLLDGGLDLTYIGSPKCVEHGCPNPPEFHPTHSSSFHYNGTALNYTYGYFLHAYGAVASDFFRLTDLGTSNITFGLVNRFEEPKSYPPSTVGGVCGFGHPTKTWGGLSLITNLQQQGTIQNKILAFWLPRSMYTLGQLHVGQVSKSSYHGKITWMSSGAGLYWSGVISDISVNNKSTGYCQQHPTKCGFIVDLAGPSMLLNKAISPIVVAGNCSNLHELPEISLTIGGEKFTLAPTDYVLRIEHRDSLTCESGIQAGVAAPFMVLGSTWITKFYTILDFEQNKLGFANSAHP